MYKKIRVKHDLQMKGIEMKTKNKFFISPVILMALVVAMVFGTGFVSATSTNKTPGAQTSSPQTEEMERTVMVTGQGEVQAVPDTDVLWVGVQTEAETAEAAMDENNVKMQALMDSLTSSGIKTNDIQTKRVNLYPRYQQDETANSRTLAGYTANNTVSIRTTKLDTLGTLLDDVVKAGANTIDNIQFEMLNSEKLVEQAREAAVMNAKEKAEQLAALTGATLGDVYSIQESSYTPSPVMQDTVMAESAAPIAPGTQSISIQVQITWSLIVE
jgi:uncharacterized protein YggE